MLRAFKGTGLVSGAKHSPAICNNPGQALQQVQRFVIQGTPGDKGDTDLFPYVFPQLYNPVTTLKQFPAITRGKHHADSGHPSGAPSERDRRQGGSTEQVMSQGPPRRESSSCCCHCLYFAAQERGRDQDSRLLLPEDQRREDCL